MAAERVIIEKPFGHALPAPRIEHLVNSVFTKSW